LEGANWNLIFIGVAGIAWSLDGLTQCRNKDLFPCADGGKRSFRRSSLGVFFYGRRDLWWRRPVEGDGFPESRVEQDILIPEIMKEKNAPGAIWSGNIPQTDGCSFGSDRMDGESIKIPQGGVLQVFGEKPLGGHGVLKDIRKLPQIFLNRQLHTFKKIIARNFAPVRTVPLLLGPERSDRDSSQASRSAIRAPGLNRSV